MRLLDFTSGIGAKTKHVPRDLPAMRLGSVTTSTRASLLVRVFVPFWHVIYWPLRPFLNPPLASENDACCFMVLRKHTPTILGCSTSVFISRNQPKDSGVSNLWDTGATFPPYATSTTKAPSFKHRTSSPVFCQQCPYFWAASTEVEWDLTGRKTRYPEQDLVPEMTGMLTSTELEACMCVCVFVDVSSTVYTFG